jgi:1-acyl-sn-glycerol-3-phosphate acyltransferase
MRFDPDRLDGRDPKAVAALLPLVAKLNAYYMRVRREGLEHLEAVAGEPVLFVGNHNSGVAGPDVACTLGMLWDTFGAEHPIYALAHDYVMRQLRAIGRAIQPYGALRASPENALRALESGAKVLVYPGGDIEAFRHSRHRDVVTLGERTGFVRVAQRAGVAIVPIVAQGAHRSAWIFHDGEGIVRALGLRQRARIARFPLALALPWGLAVGPWLPYLPLPFSVKLRALAPIRVAPNDDPRDVAGEVRVRMQRALDEMRA